MPTSITTAPGLIQSPLTKFGLPMAATTISAWRTMSGRFWVLEWHTVTVASKFLSKAATGVPTMSDLPSTTAFLPLTSVPEAFNNSITPLGVHGTKEGLPPFLDNSPTFSRPKPSTSLSFMTALVTRVSFKWPGKGNWMRMPWTPMSLFNCWISNNNSDSEISSGNWMRFEWILDSSAALSFIRT